MSINFRELNEGTHDTMNVVKNYLISTYWTRSSDNKYEKQFELDGHSFIVVISNSAITISSVSIIQKDYNYYYKDVLNYDLEYFFHIISGCINRYTEEHLKYLELMQAILEK